MSDLPAGAACPDRWIELAGRLADAARAEVRPHYRKVHVIEDKADASPVTAIDRAAEARLRGLIEQAAPGHGIYGEEYGAERTDAEFVWVLDPIDGTKSFITGNPLFGTLIALLREGRPILGVIEMPVLEERWVGALGYPSLHQDASGQREVACRACPALDRAITGACSPHMFRGGDAAAYERLSDAVKTPLYGGDCFNYALLATGFKDIVVEANLSPYDYLANVPIIEGAGGVVTDWRGAPLSLESDGRVLAAGDPALHAAALATLAAT